MKSLIRNNLSVAADILRKLVVAFEMPDNDNRPVVLRAHDLKNIRESLINIIASIDNSSDLIQAFSDEILRRELEFTRLKQYEAAFDSIVFAITGTRAGQDVIDGVDIEILTRNAVTAVRQLEADRLQALRTAAEYERPWIAIDPSQKMALEIRASAVYALGDDIKKTLACAGELRDMPLNASRLIGFVFSRADYYRRQAEGAL